ncbi:MAG: GH116 family glycosyl hydrolase [Isosphaeraceae bacterium]
MAGLGVDFVASARCDESGRFDPARPEVVAFEPLERPLFGGVRRALRLVPGGGGKVSIVLAWHFPHFRARGLGDEKVGHHYARRFPGAWDVVQYVLRNYDRLTMRTRNWVSTWYDSTLPYWLLDRTMANTSTLATTTCYRLADGRFWAWEGVGCCEGTCTHVWHYAQAPARLFPELEKDQRRRVDFGLAQHPDGGVGMRAGLTGSNEPAHDGQCGRILGAYREHQMSRDDAFLRAVWPGVKKAVEYMMARDGDGDGMVEGPQPNTLDAAWYGRVSFLASLYLAALHAGAAMADEVGDPAFAARCRAVAERGSKTILGLFNGEYFIQQEDPAHSNEVGVGQGCYVDQVFGQTWAHWVGLGTLFDRGKQLQALRALWSYNFLPDVGPFRQRFERGRWYAVAGDGGLLMATWPKGGQNPRFKDHWQYMYFNECMSGFEWQAAAHMVFEGRDQPDLLQAGLAVARAIHDRYDARRRNPYNEVECSDHYSRAMASYGLFLAVCGYEHHGPKGHLGFAPRLSPDDFRAAFTAAGCWGSYAQTRTADSLTARLTVRYGLLRLKTLAVAPRDPARGAKVSASVARYVDQGGKPRPLPATVRFERDAVGTGRSVVTFGPILAIEQGQTLEVSITPE